MLSVALSLGLRRAAVSRRPVVLEPGLSSSRQLPAGQRLPGHLVEVHIGEAAGGCNRRAKACTGRQARAWAGIGGHGRAHGCTHGQRRAFTGTSNARRHGARKHTPGSTRKKTRCLRRDAASSRVYRIGLPRLVLALDNGFRTTSGFFKSALTDFLSPSSCPEHSPCGAHHQTTGPVRRPGGRFLAGPPAMNPCGPPLRAMALWSPCFGSCPGHGLGLHLPGLAPEHAATACFIPSSPPWPFARPLSRLCC